MTTENENEQLLEKLVDFLTRQGFDVMPSGEGLLRKFVRVGDFFKLRQPEWRGVSLVACCGRNGYELRPSQTDLLVELSRSGVTIVHKDSTIDAYIPLGADKIGVIRLKYLMPHIERELDRAWGG